MDHSASIACALIDNFRDWTLMASGSANLWLNLQKLLDFKRMRRDYRNWLVVVITEFPNAVQRRSLYNIVHFPHSLKIQVKI